MKVAYEIYDPAVLTVDEAEALRDAGLELEMVDNGMSPMAIVAWMDMGKIFDREEERRIERDIS